MTEPGEPGTGGQTGRFLIFQSDLQKPFTRPNSCSTPIFDFSLDGWVGGWVGGWPGTPTPNFRLRSIERGSSRTLANQTDTEGAPGSSFEPGSWVALSFFHVNCHQPRGSSPVKPPAAPPPFPWMFHQSAKHWIRVHVIQLFLLLSFAVHIEIIKSRLPERSQRFSRLRKWQSHLPHALPYSALP